MKKIVCLLLITLTSNIMCMEKESSDTAEITYRVESTLKTPYSVEVCRVAKKNSSIFAKYMMDSMTPDEHQKFEFERSGNVIRILSTSFPLVCRCSPNNDNDFFETNEFDVKKGGEFLLTFDADSYEVTTTHNGITKKVDSDTIANGKARYAQRLAQSSSLREKN